MTYLNKLKVLQYYFLIAFALLAVLPLTAIAQESSTTEIQSTSESSEQKQVKTPFQKRLDLQKEKSALSKQLGTALPKKTDIAERIVKGIIYCIAVFALLTYINGYLKSKKENSATSPIDLLAKKAIGNRMSLLLVEVEGKKFFLSQTQDIVQMLAPLSDPLGLSEELSFDMESTADSGASFERPRAVHQ